MRKIKNIIKEEVEDYRGYHTAPTAADSPMHDVTNAFGEDMYDGLQKAVRYFGNGYPYDAYSISLIQRVRNKPNAQVKIYRAVPIAITNQEKINNYEKQKAYILKTGRLPQGVDNWKNSREYYDWISGEIDKLKALPAEQDSKVKINSGDWVTINPAYARDHGKNHIGKYRVLTKTVPARTLFTDGNDIHEWGYVENGVNETPDNKKVYDTIWEELNNFDSEIPIEERKRKRTKGMALPLGRIYSMGLGEQTNQSGKKLYYHGRNQNRPYAGKYIYITDSLGYAAGYSDGKELYVYTLPFGENKLFSIKNPMHLRLLNQYIDDYTLSMIFKSSGRNEEIDWAALSYISTDEFENPEDLFEHLGFYGIRLKERAGIDSIYVFDEKYLTPEGTIDITTPENQEKIRQFYKDFTKDKNFLEEEK